MFNYIVIIFLLLIYYHINYSKKINKNTYVIMDICDINHNNKLDFREFRNCSVDKEKSKNVFVHYDSNNSEYLDLYQLNQLVI